MIYLLDTDDLACATRIPEEAQALCFYTRYSWLSSLRAFLILLRASDGTVGRSIASSSSSGTWMIRLMALSSFSSLGGNLRFRQGTGFGFFGAGGHSAAVAIRCSADTGVLNPSSSASTRSMSPPSDLFPQQIHLEEPFSRTSMALKLHLPPSSPQCSSSAFRSPSSESRSGPWALEASLSRASAAMMISSGSTSPLTSKRSGFDDMITRVDIGSRGEEEYMKEGKIPKLAGWNWRVQLIDQISEGRGNGRVCAIGVRLNNIPLVICREILSGPLLSLYIIYEWVCLSRKSEKVKEAEREILCALDLSPWNVERFESSKEILCEI